MDWHKYFYYDATSPSCLRWKVERYANNHLLVSAGDMAGSLDKGILYYYVGLLGEVYAVHRVIYEMFHGKIPDNCMVDHINRCRSDNNISNLRLADYTVNSRNISKSVRNTSGETGVQARYIRDGQLNFVAKWTEMDGTRRCKSFAANKYGEEAAFALAVEARRKALEDLNAQGAGYSETHGK